MSTLAAVAEATAARLAAAGIDEPRREARYLIRHALQIEVPALEPARPVDTAGEARLDALVARRAAREPLSKIVGSREFWSLPFRVTAATLDPRPDSETVVEAALAAVPDRGAAISILDLGAGSGCLLLALLSELPAAAGLGVDVSEEALRIARENAHALGFGDRARFVAADWGTGIAGSFDLIVANPPYVPSGEIASLAPEVALHDPQVALDGGADGLDAYRSLSIHLTRLLAPQGTIALEIGLHQADGVTAILHDAGAAVRARGYDLARRARCLVATRI